MVYESLYGCGEVERKKIEEGLRNLDEKILRRPNSRWNPELQWLPNAELEHQRKPFHAILAIANPGGMAFVLRGDEVDDNNALWRVSRTRIVPREAAQMAQAVGPLMLFSEVIRLVDPHFNPNREEYCRALQEFVRVALENRAFPLTTIEVHLSADGEGKPTAEYFSGRCQAVLPNLIPAGVRVRLIRWRKKDGGEELHNRYVLTEFGGIRFGAGLDEGGAGETDELEILDNDAYRTRFGQYDPGGTTFDLADQVVVVGTRH